VGAGIKGKVTKNQQQQQIAQTALLANVVGQVGCGTVIIIALCFGGGVLLDRFLDTKPIFTILFTMGSVPLTLYAIVRLTLATVTRAQDKIDSMK
jgi:F0F1-type ATP synthase assembly protein I